MVANVPDIPIMIDSGFRRGSDVIKALALGASFVFLARPFNYAAACAGEAGVQHAVTLLADEMRRDMALLGVTKIRGLSIKNLYETSRLAAGD
jgi:L-lactate dehydrogenase (cytochrome)